MKLARSVKPSWIQLESVIPLDGDEELTATKVAGISRDGLQRHHRDRIVQLSPRRVGMKLRDALAIANGD
jgi:hypothetical protein